MGQPDGKLCLLYHLGIEVLLFLIFFFLKPYIGTELQLLIILNIFFSRFYYYYICS